VDVGAAGDLPDGAVRVVRVGRRELGIARWGDSYYAIRNVCPHQLGPLAAGRVRLKLVLGERFGQLAVEEGSPVIACPWHGWEFELASGCALTDPAFRVAVYPVSVEDERLVVEVPQG
jgi:nitrite reductase/ring-hydroxylating ferredoxin subunit